jgi:hypothetical protein
LFIGDLTVTVAYSDQCRIWSSYVLKVKYF